MSRNPKEYWELKGYHDGEPVIRLKRDLLNKDFGSEKAEMIIAFRNAHFAFMEIENIPGAEYELQRAELSKMIATYLKAFPDNFLYQAFVDVPAAMAGQSA